MQNAPDYVIFASYGNDSIALIQLAADMELENVSVLYSDTGWAADWWAERVERGEDFARRCGFRPARTESIGLEALVRQRKAWPRQGMQFCTQELKMAPAAAWLDERDPKRQAVCLVGVRREESANRKDFPEFTPLSPNHGGRTLWAPMVCMGTAKRDALIRRAGFDPLPHRSMECFPCINSNRTDLLKLSEDEDRTAHIEAIEQDMGLTSKGKPRTMFRPYRHMGATGIREIVRWAKSPRGKFDPDDGTGGGGCDAGWCGS